jgi:SAM-dependent methyltransferase
VGSSPRFLENRRSDVRDASLWSPFAYIGRRLRELVREMVSSASLTSGARVLDYGSADSPYRSELPDGVEYVAADLAGNDRVDVCLSEDGTVPLPDGSFDLVLSTQVLEHVEDTRRYLAESFRLLRPGGTLALSTHGIMYYHRDPEDYWRWTAVGLRRVVEDVGFQVVTLYGVLGLAAAALQLFQDGTYPFLPGFLKRPYALLMQSLIAFADRFYSSEARIQNGLVVAVRAVKPL